MVFLNKTVPGKKSALKALKQSKKTAVRNLKVKRAVKNLTKKTLKAIDAKNGDEMKKYFLSAVKAIDKAIQKKVIKKNTGARKKSVLMKKINKAK